jgi:type II secretory pathway pseudopilin PulG
MRKLSGVTFLVMLVVVVIMSVLATLAVTHYVVVLERNMDDEAQASLRLILAAERVQRMETGAYVNCADTAAVNTNLNLLLPRVNANWDYAVSGATADAFCSQAQRTQGTVRFWVITAPTAADPDPQPQQDADGC